MKNIGKIGIATTGAVLSAAINDGMEAKKQIGIAAHIGLEKPSVMEQLAMHVKDAKDKVYLIVDKEIESAEMQAQLAALSAEHPHLIIVDHKEAKDVLGARIPTEETFPFKNYRIELPEITVNYANDFDKPTHRNSKQSRRDMNRRGF